MVALSLLIHSMRKFFFQVKIVSLFKILNSHLHDVNVNNVYLLSILISKYLPFSLTTVITHIHHKLPVYLKLSNDIFTGNFEWSVYVIGLHVEIYNWTKQF